MVDEKNKHCTIRWKRRRYTEKTKKQNKMKINVDKSGKFMNLNNDIIIWHGRQQTTVAIVVVYTVAR